VDTLHVNVPTFSWRNNPNVSANPMTMQKRTTCMSHLSPNVWCRTGVVEGALRTGEGCEKGTLLGHRWGGEEWCGSTHGTGGNANYNFHNLRPLT
jgi:hypothetical protein